MNTLIIFENIPERIDRYLIPNEAITPDTTVKLELASGCWLNACSDKEAKWVNDVLDLVDQNEDDVVGSLNQYKLLNSHNRIVGPISHVYIMGAIL